MSQRHVSFFRNIWNLLMEKPTQHTRWTRYAQNMVHSLFPLQNSAKPFRFISCLIARLQGSLMQPVEEQSGPKITPTVFKYILPHLCAGFLFLLTLHPSTCLFLPCLPTTLISIKQTYTYQTYLCAIYYILNCQCLKIQYTVAHKTLI